MVIHVCACGQSHGWLVGAEHPWNSHSVMVCDPLSLVPSANVVLRILHPRLAGIWACGFFLVASLSALDVCAVLPRTGNWDALPPFGSGRGEGLVLAFCECLVELTGKPPGPGF